MTIYRVLKSFRFQRYPEFSVKLQYFPDKTQNNARLFLLQFGLEELHGIGLGLLGYLVHARTSSGYPCKLVQIDGR